MGDATCNFTGSQRRNFQVILIIQSFCFALLHYLIAVYIHILKCSIYHQSTLSVHLHLFGVFILIMDPIEMVHKLLYRHHSLSLSLLNWFFNSFLSFHLPFLRLHRNLEVFYFFDFNHFHLKVLWIIICLHHYLQVFYFCVFYQSLEFCESSFCLHNFLG